MLRLLLKTVAFSVLCLIQFFAKNVAAQSKHEDVSETLTVNIAHITLMHPYLESTETSFYEYFYTEPPLDPKPFQTEIENGWYPDNGYAALKNIIKTLDDYHIDIVSFAGIHNRKLARHLTYYLYSQALRSSLIPVSGAEQKFECDLCRRLNYSEEAESLIFSRYPMYHKLTHCKKASKTSFLKGAGCLLSSKVVNHGMYFTVINVNTGPLDQLETARKNSKKMEERRSDRRFVSKGTELPKDYFRSIQPFFEITQGTTNTISGTTADEVVIYTGFWGTPINKVLEDLSITTIKGKWAMLRDSLGVDLGDIPVNLTSLDFMSNKESRRWFTAHNMQEPVYNTLADFVAISKKHATPEKVSKLKVATPLSGKELPRHKIVYRTVIIPKPSRPIESIYVDSKPRTEIGW